jgi:5-methylcytosine-specific restriction endonuclease McrA
MSDRAPYSRVYWSVMDDPKFDGIREDLRLFGAWALLLILADMSYPAPAYFPRSTTPATVRKLADCGLIDLLTHGRYRMHGLEAERSRRSQSASQNSSLRWSRPPVEGGKPTSRRTRFKVLERDGYRCRYCGRGSDVVALDVDHVVPVREGGKDDMDNLVAACIDCNSGKSGHPLRAHTDDDARASEPEDARAILDETSKDETSKAKPSAHENYDGRDDLEAFLLITRRAPTPKQRRLLDEVMDRHDLTGPAWAADLMLKHPNDPIGAVIEADKAWRAERIAAAQAQEAPKPKPRRPRGLPQTTREIMAEMALLQEVKP